MSQFRVSIEKISWVKSHPNADRLDLAGVEGLDFQFVVGRNEFSKGDLCVYFPVDSLIPAPVLAKIGLVGKLAGSQHNRVKTVQLRGAISQGLAVKIDLLDPVSPDTPIGFDVTSILGVTKYEPAPIACRAGTLLPLPDGVEVYDIEGADRYPQVIHLLMDREVCITEKLEGSNWSLTILDGKIFVNQRNDTIKEYNPLKKGFLFLIGKIRKLVGLKERAIEHEFWRVARDQGLIDVAKRIYKDFGTRSLTLRGEYCGPNMQGNIYKLSKNRVFLFDIKMDGRYIRYRDFYSLCETYELETVPVLARDVVLGAWLRGMTVKEASNGVSLLCPIKREGIVIRPVEEGRHQEIGRLIIKQRSPEYLAQNEF